MTAGRKAGRYQAELCSQCLPPDSLRSGFSIRLVTHMHVYSGSCKPLYQEELTGGEIGAIFRCHGCGSAATVVSRVSMAEYTIVEFLSMWRKSGDEICGGGLTGFLGVFISHLPLSLQVRARGFVLKDSWGMGRNDIKGAKVCSYAVRFTKARVFMICGKP